MTLVASDNEICEGESVTLTATNSGGLLQQVFSGSNNPNPNLSIPNNSTNGVSSSITLSGSGGLTLTSTDVIIITLNISHNTDQDLDIFLVDPSGTRAMLLSADNGANGNNYTNTILRTDVANIIGSAGNNTAPFNSTYRPEGTITTAPIRTGGAGGGNYNARIPANALDGAPIDGNWTLWVFDDQTPTTGTFNDWSLSIIHQLSSGYTTVVNGDPVIGPVSYSGAQNTTATATVTPEAGTHVYTVTTSDGNGCSRVSNEVSITVHPTPRPVITADYCSDRPKVRLTSDSYNSYLWSTGETTQSILVDLAGNYTVTVTDAYGCTGSGSIQVADELVVNGDFTLGNVGFTSGYTYHADLPGLVPAGQGELYNDTGTNGYGVGTSGQNYHINFWGLDHTNNTSGARNFMLVNGHGNIIVWQEVNIPVTPNTDYYFSAWAISLNNVGPFARLRFEINGVQVGTIATLTTGTNSNANPWKPQDRFYGIWNSGAATTATIRIINLEFALGGNDFGLDDISFGTLSNIPFGVTAGHNSPLCSGDTLLLTTSLSGGKLPITYSWTGPNGFVSTDANPVIPNATVDNSGTYIVSVTDGYGCDPVSDTITVTINPVPVIPDQSTVICSGETFTVSPVNGVPNAATIVPAGTTYTWSAPSGSGFTGGSAQLSPQTSISQTLVNTTTSPVTATYLVTPVAGSCAGETFQLVVTVNPSATANAGSNQVVCASSPAVNLAGSIGGAATSATWSGGSGTFIPNSTTVNAIYTPSSGEITAGTVTLTLTTNDPDGTGPCVAATSSMTITINQNPQVTASTTNILCYGAATGAIDLSVSGGTGTYTYAWTASNGGVIPAGQASGQDLTGLVAGTYTVIVTDGNSCPATYNTTLTEPTQLAVSETHTSILCAGQNSDVTITVSGGIAPYQVTWAGGSQAIAASGGTAIIQQPAGTRVYTVTDNNGCTTTVSVIAVLDPNTAPEITTCPSNADLNGCGVTAITGLVYSSTPVSISLTDFTNAGGAATDNCAVTSITYSDAQSGSCPIVVTRTFIVSDGSGLSDTCKQLISIDDNNAPTFTPPAGFTAYKDGSCNYNISETITGVPTLVADNCDTNPSVTYTDGSPVQGSCTDELIVTRTWRVEDDCGNFDTASQIITIRDTTPPGFTAPANISVTSNLYCVPDTSPTTTGYPTGIADNCATNLTATYSDTYNDSDPCRIVITRTWRLADNCGNSAPNQVQIITVYDSLAPFFTRPPDIEILSNSACTYNSTPANTGDVFDEYDNCSLGIQATYTDAVNNSDPCNIVISRTWSLTDNCGNTAANQVQTITVKDVLSPDIFCPPDATIALGDPNLPAATGSPVVTDNCDTSPLVTYSDTTLAGSCVGNYRIQRTWTAADTCGNTSVCYQDIFVQDIEPPVFVVSCSDIGDQLAEANNGAQYQHPDNSWDVVATDNSGVLTIEAYLTGATVSGPHNTLNGVLFNEGLTTVTWTAMDDCGNSVSCSFTVTINASADVSIEKTAAPNPAVAGQQLVYTLTVRNSGPAIANSITVRDSITAFPSPEYSTTLTGPWASWNGTLVLASPLGVGDSTKIYIRGTVDEDSCGTVSNTASANSTNLDNNPGNNQVTIVTTLDDTEPPVITAPGPFEFCVEDLSIAQFNGDTSLNYTPDYPSADYYLFETGSTELDLNIATYSDNCCDPADGYSIRWTITFNGSEPAVSGTGQPSTYGSNIPLWGDGVNYLDRIHTITYWITDCNGNESNPVTSNLTIKPRPNLIKVNE